MEPSRFERFSVSDSFVATEEKGRGSSSPIEFDFERICFPFNKQRCIDLNLFPQEAN